MSPLSRSTRLFGAIVLAGVIFYLIEQQFLHSPLALPLYVSLVITWTVPSPVRYLALLAILSELLTTGLGGLAALAILTPWVVRRVFFRAEVDASFSFAGLMLMTALVQSLIVVLPDLYLYQSLAFGHIVTTLLTVSVLAFFTIILFVNQLPYEQRSIISLEGHRLHD